MFDNSSRYSKLVPYLVLDRRGRVVAVVAAHESAHSPILGYHKRKQGQRLDHLAARYLDDPVGYWRICDANDAMLPEAFSEARELAIPTKEG
jgi:hypothetical protein